MHIHINEVIKGWEKKNKDCKSNFIKLSILICIQTLLSLKNAMNMELTGVQKWVANN